MGTYVYTARATGRVPVWIRGGVHWVFPLEFSYKPNWYNHEATERWERQAERQAKRIEAREDWSGYVSLDGLIYHTDSAYYNDGYGNPNNYIGKITKIGREWWALP